MRMRMIIVMVVEFVSCLSLSESTPLSPIDKSISRTETSNLEAAKFVHTLLAPSFFSQ